MADQPPDPDRLPASVGDPPKRADGEVEVLPKSKDGAGPKAAASSFVEMMSMQTGAAALASNFVKLPESIQKQTLENEAERVRLAYEFEAKNLSAMAADRESERKDRLVRFEKVIGREANKDRREYWFGVMVVVISAIGVGLLGWAGQWTIAAHVINTVVAGGLSWLGGKSVGLAKAAKQRQLAPGDKDKDKDKDDDA